MPDASAAHAPLPAALAALAATLAAAGVRLDVADALPSTNATLLDRARAGDTAACLLMAREQTAGRGRLGRAWQSRAGDSLTFSLAMSLAPADWSGLSLAIGLALADALDPPAPGRAPRIRIKWPNDLLLDGAGKLGGILIETVSAGPQAGTARVAVVGVGINLAAPRVDDAAFGVAGLRDLDPGADVDATLARVALPLVRALQQFGRDGFAPWQARFAARDALAGREVIAAGPGQAQGRADGVDAQGALRLVPAPGAPARLVHAGEVSVRLAAAPPG